MPKISVIVPVYNVEQYLPQCLDSIINQTFKDIEIICINDGSTDNSGKILEQYAQKDDRIKVIHQENKGISMVRNIGVEATTGEWISFIDSDDYIDKDFYKTLLSAAQKSGADVVQCGYNIFDDKTKKTCFTTPVIASNFQDVIQNFNRGYVWNKIWKSDLIKHNSLKFYPGIYIEDILFSVEAANFIKKFQIIEYIGNFYRCNPNSICRSSKNEEKIKEDIYFVCSKIIRLLEKQNRTDSDIAIVSNFLIENLIKPKYVQEKKDFKKYEELFPNNNLLQKKRQKAIRRKFIRLSLNDKEFILFGYNLWKNY